MLNKVYCGDSLVLMKKIPDESIDLIVTDPPFGIGFGHEKQNYNRSLSNTIAGYNEVEKEKYYDFCLSWMTQAFRVLKKTGTAFIVSGWTNLKDVLNAIDDVGFTTINHIIWKYQFGVFTKRKFVTSHYHILFVAKDPKRYKFNKIEHYPEDVWFVRREYWRGKKRTPTKLPLTLVEKMIMYGSDEGDVVLDPFAGSGTVGVAAKRLGRKFLCFEIVKEYCDLAQERIKNTPVINLTALREIIGS